MTERDANFKRVATKLKEMLAAGSLDLAAYHESLSALVTWHAAG